MPFAYYHRLSRSDQAIYRRSDAVPDIPIPDAAGLAPLVADLREALESEGRAAVQSAAGELVGELLQQLQVPGVRVKVLAHRPEISGGELHGLYEAEDGEMAVISVWMRTAAQGKVVAFKTFLRTLLHEVVHHLDYDYFELEDSFHTHGFLRRESSLVRQLLAGTPAPKTRAKSKRPEPKRSGSKSKPDRRLPPAPTAQLELPW